MAQEPSTKRARTDAAAENENPYLAHLNEPVQRSSGAAMSGKAPFDGWMPRKSTGKQVEQAMVSSRSTLAHIAKSCSVLPHDGLWLTSCGRERLALTTSVLAGGRRQPVQPAATLEKIPRHL